MVGPRIAREQSDFNLEAKVEAKSEKFRNRKKSRTEPAVVGPATRWPDSASVIKKTRKVKVGKKIGKNQKSKKVEVGARRGQTSDKVARLSLNGQKDAKRKNLKKLKK